MAVPQQRVRLCENQPTHSGGLCALLWQGPGQYDVVVDYRLQTESNVAALLRELENEGLPDDELLDEVRRSKGGVVVHTLSSLFITTPPLICTGLLQQHVGAQRCASCVHRQAHSRAPATAAAVRRESVRHIVCLVVVGLVLRHSSRDPVVFVVRRRQQRLPNVSPVKRSATPGEGRVSESPGQSPLARPFTSTAAASPLSITRASGTQRFQRSQRHGGGAGDSHVEEGLAAASLAVTPAKFGNFPTRSASPRTHFMSATREVV